MRRFIILLSVLLSAVNLFGQDELLSGLYFSSHEVIQDKRTSLNLTPYNTLKFRDGITLEMDAKFRQGDGYYGYIFRMIGDDQTNIDLVSNLASTESNFWLVLKDTIVFSSRWADIPNGSFDRWMKIKVEIDVRNSKIVVWLNGNRHEAVIPRVRKLKNYSLVFGASQSSPYYNTDVCPMTLKNIRILDSKKNLISFWKLSRHSESKVYDEIEHAVALVKNPRWIIDEHINWRKYRDLKFNDIWGITWDDVSGRMYFVDRKSVYILSIASSRIDTIQFASGLPYFEKSKQLIYNKYTNELWSYSFNKNEISKFSFTTRKWSVKDTVTRLPDYWQHNKIISPVDSTLVTLFGYGHYKYKSIIQRFNQKSNTWESTNLSAQIYPRYLAASGLMNNQELLVFGGYGSKSGQQEVSPEFYYELYSYNLKTHSVKKLWTIDEPSTPFVPCESLIPDLPAGYFYTLLYNRSKYATYLHLARFGIENNQYQLFHDSIPYNFLDTESWSSLFLDQKSSQLIAVTSHNSDVSLYTIAYPPLMPDDVYQSTPIRSEWYFPVLFYLLVPALLLVAFFLIRSRIKKKADILKSETTEHIAIEPIKHFDRPLVSAVHLIDNFQIYDQNGNHISAAFSPTLQQLFLYIFLHTVKNGEGVTASRLDEVLWYDKSDESARNNRNVNISKLRTILEDVEGLDLVKEGSFWKIRMEPAIFCDYTEILLLINASKERNLDEPEIHKLLSLISYGVLLPQVQTEWADEFKSHFTNEIIDCLSLMLSRKEVKVDYNLGYHIADAILISDQLNDEAFAVKCSSLCHLGKRGAAKHLYDSFSREYKQVLGIDYEIPFNEIMRL